MKKTIIALAVIALVAPLAFGQEVLSRNAVGYVNTVVQPSKFGFFTFPFMRVDGSDSTVSNEFHSLPNGTQISMWDVDIQQYVTRSRGPAGWGAAGTNVLVPGTSFFLKAPASTNLDVYMLGEVPDKTTAPTSYLPIQASAKFTAIGNHYPVSALFTSLTVAAMMPSGSQVSFYNSTGGTYLVYARGPAGWAAGANAYTLTPGEGFFLKSTVAYPGGVWTNVKPYTWP